MTFDAPRRQSLAFLAAALAAPAIGRAQPASAQAASSARAADAHAGFVDLMPAFWAAYDAHLGDALPARAQALFDQFFRPHDADCRRAGYEPTLAAIAARLPGIDQRAAAARTVHANFAQNYASNLHRFRQALPDFDDAASPVTLMPSLGHFDAHLQPNGASLPLFFDPDAIAFHHGAGVDLDVLFSHELFHCYQGQKNPVMCLDPAAPVYVSLWMEGTATYASERMNPGASSLHVLLDDVALAQADDASLRTAAQGLLANLDATDDAVQSLFFQTGHHGDGWPPRAGYAVGLRIARGLGATMTLPQMAALPAPQARDTLAQALKRMSASTPS